MSYISAINNLSFYSSIRFPSRFTGSFAMTGIQGQQFSAGSSAMMGMQRQQFPAASPAMAGRQGRQAPASPSPLTDIPGQRLPAGSSAAPGVQGQQLPGQAAAGKTENSQKIPGKPDFDTYECQTCKNRKYKDGSNDPGVSFKTPTRVSPEAAPYAIRAHESEHVAHAWAQAQKEDKEIVSQSVTYHTSICPECGRTYMSGGTTRTVFRSSPETYDKEPVKKGVFLDLTA